MNSPQPQPPSPSDDVMESVCDIVGHLAHDLNNLMTPVMACGQMLKEGMAPTHPLYFCAEQITEAGEQCHELARKLQVMGSKRRGQHKLDFNELIRNVLADYKLPTETGADLVLDLCPEPLLCVGDHSQFQVLVSELVNNALAFMPDGGKATLSTERVGNQLEFVVEDKGIGIAPEHLPLIYKPYFTTVHSKRSKGFGLAMVYGMVRRYEGEIEVTSEVGQGTRVAVRFPLFRESDSTAG